MLKIYNPGRYRVSKESSLALIGNRLWEYLTGVTVARASINRLKPVFIGETEGDILEIGGCDDYFKRHYKKGRFVNLDIKEGPYIDIVADAAKLSMVEDSSFSAVICISVLEHAVDPIGIMREISRVLKPGGRALISTPWLFETHMEPTDYWRFSGFSFALLSPTFETERVERANGYFGLLAHMCQHTLPLRFTLGVIFLALDSVSSRDSRWSTQLTFLLKKGEG